MDNENTTNDKLVIPLNFAVKQAREKHNRDPITENETLLRCIIVLALSLFALYYYLPFRGLVVSGIYLFLFVLGCGFWINCWKRNVEKIKKVQPVYDDPTIPLLTLDSQGITCPLILLPDEDKIVLMKENKTSLQVKWKDIDSWVDSPTDSYHPQYGGGLGLSRVWWLLRLKNGLHAPAGNLWVSIRKDGFLDFQQDIFDFAQRFLPFEITPVYSSMNLKNS